MIYRKFQDITLSGLGLGMMRLPVVNGDDSVVDEAAAADQDFRSNVRFLSHDRNVSR